MAQGMRAFPAACCGCLLLPASPHLYQWFTLMRILSLFLFLVPYSLSVLADDAPPAITTKAALLRCGTTVDVVGQRMLAGQDLLIQAGIITQIGDNLAPPADASVIDLSDAYCLPGLIDAHVHLLFDSTTGTLGDNMLSRSSADNALLGLQNLWTLLHTGITTIRIPGDIDYGFAVVSLRNAINRGEFVAPRMKVAPHALSQLGGHVDLNAIRPDGPKVVGTIVEAGVDNVRDAVRRQVKYGADWIKITASGGVMSQHDDPRVQGWTDEEIFAFADEAHRLGVKITAHVHGNQAGLTVARAGFDSIEHGTMIEDETIAVMKENDVALVPTLYVLEWILEQGRSGGITEDNLKKAVDVSRNHRQAFMKAYEAGIKIVMGSDPIFPHEESVREFTSMVRAGLPEWESIRAGTINAAELLGLASEIGSLEVGKAADVIAVLGNPVEDITVLEHVRFVMRGGTLVHNDIQGD